MSGSTLSKIELPTPPETLMLLRDLLEDPALGADTLLPVVEKDIALTANLLKAVNSSLYSLRREIGTVKEALVFLGNIEVMNLAFGMSVRQLLSDPLEYYGFDPHQLWWHSMGVAYAAGRAIDDMGQSEDKGRAFTAGLLHDMGALVVDGRLREAGTMESKLSINAERNLTRIDHARAGAEIAEAWGFPESLVEAIRHHHDPHRAKKHRELAVAVHAGDSLCQSLGIGYTQRDDDDRFAVSLLPALGVPTETVEQLQETLPNRTEVLISMCGVPS